MLRFVMAGLLALSISSGFLIADDKLVASDTTSLKFIPPTGPIKTLTLVVFKIETNGKQVLVKVNSPNVELRKDSGGGEVVVLFRTPGDYKIWGVTSLNDQIVETELLVTVIKNDDDHNPPPGPSVDPLVKEFQDAYNADSTVDKRERLAGLVRAMRYGSDQASVKATNGDVVLAVSQKTKDEIGDNLMGVRKAIGKYLNSNLPQENQQMTTDLRKKYAAEYNKVADALEKMNK